MGCRLCRNCGQKSFGLALTKHQANANSELSKLRHI
jgi:hypothetical protein